MRLRPSLFLLLIASIGFADDGTWVGNTDPRIQVKMNTLSHGIAVTVNRDKDQIPKSIGITFINANGKRTALELKAVELGPEAGANPGLTQTHYAGTLNPANQSFIGFEIRIPFRSESPKIIRSEDLKRLD